MGLGVGAANAATGYSVTATITLGTFDADAALLDESLVQASVDASGLLVFSRIGDTVTPASVWRSAIELVTEQAAALHDAMSAIAGPHAQLLVTGGWSVPEGLPSSPGSQPASGRTSKPTH